jgi:hypothetical protein
MFDLNIAQANLTRWYILRGEPPNPVLAEVEKITRDTEVLRNEKFEWLIIGTPPLDLSVIENAVVVADAVIIPGRARRRPRHAQDGRSGGGEARRPRNEVVGWPRRRARV